MAIEIALQVLCGLAFAPVLEHELIVHLLEDVLLNLCLRGVQNISLSVQIPGLNNFFAYLTHLRYLLLCRQVIVELLLQHLLSNLIDIEDVDVELRWFELVMRVVVLA